MIPVPRRARIAEAIAVGLFTLWVAWPFVQPGRYVLAYDTVTYGGPNLAFTFAQWKHGHVPTWNDTLFGGVYHLANAQAAVLYPVKLLFLPLRAGEALDLITATHLFLLAFGMWWLLARRLRLRPPAAGLGAIVVVGGGVAMARSLQFEQIAVVAWLPWAMGALDRCVEPAATLDRAGRLRATVWAAVALGLLLVAGHPQQVFIAAPLLGVWTAVRALDRRVGGSSWRTLALPLGTVAAAGALALALAMAQLLPMASAAGESASFGNRTLRSSSERAYSVEPGIIPSTLLGAGFTDQALSSAASFEALGFVGAAAAALAVFGIAAGLRQRRATTIGLLVLGTGALLFAIGPRCSGPADAFTCSSGGLPYRAGFQLVPGFSLARVPGRWLVVTTIAFAVLAALGADAIARRSLTRRAVAGATVGVAVLAAAALVAPTSLPDGLKVAAPIAWTVLAAAVVGLAWLGLRPAGARAVGVVLALVPIALVALELGWQQPNSFARASRSPVAFDQLGGTTADFVGDARVLSLAAQPFDDLGYLSRALKPNANATAGVRSLDGYDGGLLVTTPWVTAVDPLTVGLFDAELPLGWQSNYPPDRELLARYGVRYVLFDPVATARGLGDPNPEDPATRRRVDEQFMAEWGAPVHVEGTIETFENPNWRSDALVYHRVRPLATAGLDTKAVDRQFVVQLGGVAPDEVLVRQGDADALDCTGDCAATTATVTRPRPGVIDVQVDNPRPGLLAVPETSLPGWTVTVDGAPARLVTADAASLGVAIPEGPHAVRFTYAAPGLRVGAAVSVLALLGCAGLLGWSVVLRRRDRAALGALG